MRQPASASLLIQTAADPMAATHTSTIREPVVQQQQQHQKQHQPTRRHPMFTSTLFGAFFMTVATILFPYQLELTSAAGTASHHHHYSTYYHAQQSGLSPSRRIHWHRPMAQALTNEQQLVSDVWKEVTRQYFDTTYNGLGETGWRQKRLEAVQAVTNIGPADTPQQKEAVYQAIRRMLAALGDPYTRFLTPEQYEALTVYARGSSTGGIGVSLMVDPASGRVVVANVADNGPAATGGIRSGDVITEIDGMDVQQQDATAEWVAAKCRGQAGSNVNLAVRHATNGGFESKATQLSLKRATIKNNPVQVSTITIDNKKIGLLRVTAFSQKTVSQIIDALRTLQKQKVSALAMDLRGNAGGYMPAGVDAAKLFLKPQTRIVSEVDKTGRATIYIADGVGSETELPLYVIVDKRTASASEIFTAALQDNNHRAIVVGNSKTFGKGRIQNVQALEDGSGVAVTKAKYVTPSGRDIHGVGITPDKMTLSCGPDDSAIACLASI